MSAPVLHARGVLLPGEVERDLWVVGGHLSFERPAGQSETVAARGWIIPGLVDAHCHIGLGADARGIEDPEVLRRQCVDDVDSGALLVRDAGSPVDTRHLDGEDWAPRIIRAGRWLARPKRYTAGMGIEVEPPDLATVIAEQAKLGDGWVKIVGDWIDRSIGDLAPLWDLATLREAIDAAHALGARVAVHTYCEESLPDLIEAGVDSIEHGTGLSADLVDRVVEKGIALVPTQLLVGNFPAFAEAAGKYPLYAQRMRRLHATARDRFRAAWEAGIPMYAGTDSGALVAHGRVADEIAALHALGVPAAEALAAGSWAARDWLGRDGLVEGAHADFVVYDTDPRLDLAPLKHPRRIVLRGRVVR